MDKKAPKPKRMRRPKGMRRARVSRSVAPKAPGQARQGLDLLKGQLNVFHHFPGGTGGLSSLVPSTYAPPVMDQMRPNQARNDLVEQAPEPQAEPEISIEDQARQGLDLTEVQKTSNLLRNMEKQGMFDVPGNLPMGVVPPGFQAMSEPIPLSSQPKPKRLIRELPTQNELETLVKGDVIEEISPSNRTTEQNNILREARALRVVHPDYIRIAGAIGRGGGIDFPRVQKLSYK